MKKEKKKENINNNYNNDNDSYLFKFTNQLYENDEHFNKFMISKKNIMNISKKNVMNNSPRKKLIIKFGSDELNNNTPINKVYKKKISNIFKNKESHDITKGTDKRTFTNYIKMRTGYSPKKEKNDINNSIRNSNYYNQNMFSNYLEFNNKNNKDGDCTTKSVKFYSKSKTVKNKNMNFPEESLLNDNDKMTNKKKNKKRGSINSNNKIQKNFCDIPKKKKIKNKSKICFHKQN